MEYHMAICDDNKVDASYIEDMIATWGKQNRAVVNVDTFTSAESFLFHYADDKSYDVLLLDIEMNGMDGVTLAKEVRKENENVQIIFITGYSDYIAEGYEVSALHYLLKPVHEEKLFQILDRAASKLRKNEKVLPLEWSGESVLVPIYEIRYLEVQHNYVTIHAKEEYTVKSTLGEFEKKLDERFYRMGRSFIINLFCITRITKTEVFLTDGTRIPLPRGQYELMNRAIIAHT